MSVRVAQWIARLPPKQKVAGSNPASDVVLLGRGRCEHSISVDFLLAETKKNKKLRSPGIEPGSITWQATIITTRPRTLHALLRAVARILVCTLVYKTSNVVRPKDPSGHRSNKGPKDYRPLAPKIQARPRLQEWIQVPKAQKDPSVTKTKTKDVECGEAGAKCWKNDCNKQSNMSLMSVRKKGRNKKKIKMKITKRTKEFTNQDFPKKI